jgi:hypothetical protein
MLKPQAGSELPHATPRRDVENANKDRMTRFLDIIVPLPDHQSSAGENWLPPASASQTTFLLGFHPVSTAFSAENRIKFDGKFRGRFGIIRPESGRGHRASRQTPVE